MGRGRTTGFSDADANPRCEQLSVAQCGAAKRRHSAPGGQRDRDNRDAVAALRPLGNREAKDRVQHRKRWAAKQPQLEIAKTELKTQGLLQRSDEHAIAKIERVGEAEEQQHIGGESEEHTSELQSLMRISYAVLCLKKKKTRKKKLYRKTQ